MTKPPTHVARNERTDIPSKLLDIFVTTVGVDDVEISLDSSLMDDLGADSLDVIEMAMALEEEFSVSIDDDEIERWRTVRDVVAYVGTLTAKSRKKRGADSVDPP